MKSKKTATVSSAVPEILLLNNILTAIAHETHGFTFGSPERVDANASSAVLPILRGVEAPRTYTTLPETDRVLVSDSGVIQQINLENSSDEYVFVRSGSVFQGKGTQSRTTTRSTVISPKTKVTVECRCIHQTHGIQSGNKFEYGGIIPTEMENRSYVGNYQPQNQSTYWSNVQTSSAVSASRMSGDFATSFDKLAEDAPIHRFESSIPRVHPSGGIHDGGGRSSILGRAPQRMMRATASVNFAAPVGIPNMPRADDLASNLNQFTQAFDSVLSKVALVDGQAGLALINENGCQNIEAFDLGLSWDALHKAAVQRMGTELLRKPKKSVFEFKPEHAKEVVREVLTLPWRMETIFEHKGKGEDKSVRITGMSADGHVGEIVELDDKVIHLIILKRAA